MTNTDVSDVNLGVTLFKAWIWVEVPEVKVEVLKLSSRQSRSDMTKYVRLTLTQYFNDSRVEYES